MEIDSNPPRHFAIPAGPFTNRPPSPPPILTPNPMLYGSNSPMKIVPSYENVDPAMLSIDDLKIITQNGQELVAHDSSSSRTYESRRTAQPILDWLYLGPASIARDREWLRKNGITMLVAARDARMAGLRLMGVDRVAKELDIEATHVDVTGYHELVSAFPAVIAKINDHVLRVYRGQDLRGVSKQVQGGNMVINESNFRRGKVLVFCETGNGRSASLVAAYLMSVLGLDLASACQFIHFKRFCVSIDEELKQILKNYEEIILAQRTVHRHEIDAKAKAEANAAAASFGAPNSSSKKKSKRAFDETIEVDAEGKIGTGPYVVDQDRYLNRPVFAPYRDSQEVTMEN